MKKYFSLLLVAVIGLASCSKSDKDPDPDPNKLTQVICSLNDSQFFRMDIKYDVNGDIESITDQSGNTASYITSVNNAILVASGSFIHTEYQLYNNSRITRITKKERNSQEVTYESEVYDLTYSGATYWNKTKTQGTYYQDGAAVNWGPLEVDEFTWNNGNITKYTHRSTEVLNIEYTDEKHPSSFPFRLLNTFTPYEKENFHPINLMMGSLNKNLLKKATYTILNANKTLAEYEFSYDSQLGGYIMAMTIKEKLTPEDSDEVTENIYKYTFQYNFDPN